MCDDWVFNYIKLLVELHLPRLIATFPLKPRDEMHFSLNVDASFPLTTH